MTARPQPKKRWRWLLVALALLNIVVFGAYFYLDALRSGLIDQVTVIPDVEGVLAPSPAGSGDPIVFLVIGSDSREGLPEDWIGDFGAAGGQRADVTMLVQVIPADGRMQVLSLPRDLRVSIPGREGKDKLNAAFAFGGAELMIKTVQDEFDVGIHHYVEIDFSGFAALVDEVGGIKVSFPRPARDLKSGLSVDAGEQLLDGRQALAYARSRSYQELRDGAWIFVDATDIGRTRRQQQVLVALLGAVRGPSLLLDAPGLVTNLARHMVVDPGFRDIDFARLALAFRDLTPGDIDSVTLPVQLTTINKVSFVVPIEGQTDAVVAAFRTGGSLRLVEGADGPPATAVLNGTGVSGVASQWADWLETRGVNVVDVDDADSFDYTVTNVFAQPSSVDRAEELITLLGFGELTVGTLDPEIDVMVIIGADAGSP